MWLCPPNYGPSKISFPITIKLLKLNLTRKILNLSDCNLSQKDLNEVGLG